LLRLIWIFIQSYQHEGNNLKVTVTGSTGFVGRRLVEKLKEDSHQVVEAVRVKHADSSVDSFEVGDLSPSQDWAEALRDSDVVVHLAARVHMVKENSQEAYELYHLTNTEATLNLVKQSIVAGVKRFIFISTVKVNGEQTTPMHPFTEKMVASPEDAYGLSKYNAEQGIIELCQSTEMEHVIIRPPLVYGAGVKGNFATLLKLVKSHLPLPFGLTNNKRSMIALENLVDFIARCVDINRSRLAANEVFLIADSEPVSIKDVLKKVAMLNRTKLFLLPIPTSWMRGVAKVLGMTSFSDRVLGDLEIDTTKASKLLGWHPVVSMEEQLRMWIVDD
jgi:nucleoside-diphosphate-sugar epimerase